MHGNWEKSTPMSKFIISTPRFERPVGQAPPASAPRDTQGFLDLPSLPDKALLALGLRRWGTLWDDDKKPRPVSRRNPMLWLYPCEWYPAIPDGLPIVTISFEHSTFKAGETDDDIRFGCLAFVKYKQDSK
jgi:hypothetical protein